jgi:NADH:ubiquinone oxidoreductase subunit E
MATKIILRLCMGSACHQLGVYEVLPALQRLLSEHDLGQTVDIRGAFCLGPCMNGIVLEIGKRQFLNINPENVQQQFEAEILPYLLRGDHV